MRPVSSAAKIAASAAAVITTATGAVALHASAGASAPYTKQTLHFAVNTGPDGATKCDIVGDLYTPTSASPSNRVPAILATNGFGGSKEDQAGLGAAYASRGYVVLSYSGLGFGGSGCKITLDDPDFDGKAGSQLVSYLGGAPGIAYTDAKHTVAAPTLDVVQLDRRDHNGKRQQFDPRVGMIGGSYGGQIQFAIASVDPRLDTIVPIITWNDLSYSLAPNNTAQTTGVSTSTPGATKLNWGAGFSALGVVNGLQNAQADPKRLVGCPNFATFVCPALVTAGSTGYFLPSQTAALRHASVSSYMSKIKIPVLLAQGENDTLFNLNEAAATYQALKAQGTPVKMIWQSWGHSGPTPAPGELSLSSIDPSAQYETKRFSDWFDHYLKDDRNADLGPDFAWFRPWVSYTGNAAPAYASAAQFPVGSAHSLYLSGDGSLASTAAAVKTGTQSFVTPPAGLPSSYDPADVLSGYVSSLPQTEKDAPGTIATWSTPVLTSPVDVVGSPVLRLSVAAPAAASSGNLPARQLVLFVKIADVAPDGSASLINGDIAPIRVPNAKAPFTVTVPAMVHRFAAGHKLQLVIAGGSVNYRGGLVPMPVTITSGSTQVLTLPVTP